LKGIGSGEGHSEVERDARRGRECPREDLRELRPVVLQLPDGEMEVASVLKREVDDDRVADRGGGLRDALSENWLPENPPIDDRQDDLIRDRDRSVEETDEGLVEIEPIWMFCKQTRECLEEGGVEGICDLPEEGIKEVYCLVLPHEGDGLRRPGADDDGIRVNVRQRKRDSRQLKEDIGREIFEEFYEVIARFRENMDEINCLLIEFEKEGVMSLLNVVK
jgi:hypothetical protein